jgi:hypothetical protein
MTLLLKFLAGILVAVPLLSQSQQIPCPAPVIPPSQKLTPAQVQGQPPESADLPSVMASVKAAMQCYQDNRGSGTDALPKLTSAVFDFKTTTATVGGLSFSIFILKIGATHEVDNVSDIAFTYSVPSTSTRGAHNAKANKPLSDELANEILAAAKAVQTSGTVSGLPLSKIAINVQFGVKNDGNISLGIPVSLVTIGPSADKNKATTQSVTLTFGGGGS